MIKNLTKIYPAVLLAVVGALFFGACTTESESNQNDRVLPILGKRDVLYEMVDGEEVADTIFHTVEPFMYLNQDSTMVNSEDLKGRIWISDFFFTSCPTICPPMTAQMVRLNSELSDLKEEIYFLSFTIDPDRDTPSKLRDYREKYSINAENWFHFTGNEERTHRLGVESFLVHAGKDDTEPGGYAHGDIFTLVDREGRVRGIYHGTSVEEVTQMEKDVRKLLKHEYGVE